jgi:hypothetical protein
MRSTSEVKNKLEGVEKELAWLNEVLRDTSKMNEDVVLKNGTIIKGYKFCEYLSAAVRERTILEWVLCISS